MVMFAERFIAILEENGVRHAFGIPGGPWLPYMELMASSKIRFHLVSHEAAGGMMAAVCGRLTGTPALCHGTFGPGATNVSTGVCCAFLDRDPLIACTSVMGEEMKNRITQMNIDHEELFRPITKRTLRLTPDLVSTQHGSADNHNNSGDYIGAGGIEKAVHEGIALSWAEVPGPVHFGLPSDATNKECPHSGTASIKTSRIRKGAEQDGPQTRQRSLDRRQLKTASEIIRKAKKPIIAAGLTTVRLGLADALGRIANKHHIPIFVTPMAKGLVPPDHPSYGGVLFHALSHKVAELYGQADLILSIGYDPVEFNFEEWIGETPLIDFNTFPLDIDDKYRKKNVVFEAVGDLQSATDYLLDMDPLDTAWNAGDIEKTRNEIQSAFMTESGTFDIRSVLHVLREALPEDGIMTCDVGAHTHVIGQMWEVDRPHRLIMTNGGSSMGFGIPAAIGAKICMPERDVLCVTGDGGFLMMAGEIITARKAGLNIVFVVLSDNKLALMDVKKRWKEFDKTDIDLYKSGLIGEKSFLGVPVRTVSTEKELRDSLAGCFSVGDAHREWPLIIEARINPETYHTLISNRYTIS